MKYFTLVLVVLATFSVVFRTAIAACSIEIPYRQFTSTPGLDGTDSPGIEARPRNDNYGAINVFIRNVVKATGGSFDENDEPQDGPDGPCVFFRGEVGGPCRRRAIGAGPDDCGGQAASYDSAGGGFDPFVGELYNSVAFTAFRPYFNWLWGIGKETSGPSGLKLAQDLYEANDTNVIPLPVLGGSEQSSGWFPIDLSKFDLKKVCASPQRWRYLPPSQFLFETGCAQLGGPTNLEFITAAEGGAGNILPLLRAGREADPSGLTGFEFAAAIDNIQRFAIPLSDDPDGNAGHHGANLIHYPAFHQPYFTGWMYINKDVWSTELAPFQKIITRQARRSMIQSWRRSTSLECKTLRKILDVNNGQKQFDFETRKFVKCDKEGKPAGELTTKKKDACSADFKLTNFSSKLLKQLRAVHEFRLSNDDPSATEKESICRGVPYCQNIRDSFLQYLDRIAFKYSPKDQILPGSCKNLRKDDFVK